MSTKHKEEATYSLNKFDKLDSKLSGIILILLLFNRLQNISNKHMLQIKIKNRTLKIGARYWFWQSMKMKFIASWSKWSKLIQDDEKKNFLIIIQM